MPPSKTPPRKVKIAGPIAGQHYNVGEPLPLNDRQLKYLKHRLEPNKSRKRSVTKSAK